MKIAVWGATGHVGKAVTFELAQRTDVTVDVYVRNTGKAEEFLKKEHISNTKIYDIKSFTGKGYDGVVNCIGIGSPNIIAKYPERIFQITEEFDSLIISNALKYPKCVFINISSGAIYGTEFAHPVTGQTVVSLTPNEIMQSSYYGLAKLYSESKHRALSNLSIIDLRMFAFFSRFIDINSPYFMADICSSILRRTVLKTSADDFVRDYIHPSDLAEIILKCVITGGNTAYDLFSGAPVTKREVLEYCNKVFGLQYETDTVPKSPTGTKSNYYSSYHSAEKIGYTPHFTSLGGIEAEISMLIGKEKVQN